MKKYSVLFYPKAQSDLAEIQDYFEKVLSISASGFLEKLLAHIPVLEDNPFIHAHVRDPILKDKGYRFFQIDNYLVFYRISSSTVQIHRVLYGRRQYGSLL